MYGLWLFKELRTEYGHCKVEVFRKGYTASAVEIGGFVGNSLNLALENLDTITAPIGKSVCSFSIYDTEQVEYDDLFTPDATAYKVVISTKVDGGEYNTRWSGYVTPDFFAENLSFRTPIRISARDNIGYLNDVDFDLDTATITVRELIQAAFNRIAEDYPMSLSFVTQKQTAEGILAIDATISTYLLREMSWYEALETILHDLGLQMRWVDNNTIAVLDISQLGENFGLQRFNFVERSGYREILPAWRELSQKQDYGLRENFFEGWLKSNALTYVKSEGVKLPIPIGQAGTGISATMKYYAPNNWGVAGNTYTINPEDFAYLGAYGQTSTPFGKRIYFTGVDKADTTIAKNYMSWRQNVYKSTERMQITFKAFNSLLGASHSSPDTLLAYNPAERFLGINLGLTTGDYIRLGLKVNLFLHIGTKTYIMRETWEELSGAETSSLYFILDKVGDISEGDNMPKEQEISIGIGNIPANGQLELRIYGFTLEDKKNLQEDANAATYDWLRMVSYINDVTYSYANDNKNTGVESGVEIASLHNIKASEEYAFGQVTLYSGGINAYAGGLFKANGDELVGFKRNVDSTTYPLLELVGREIIHFNKRNYNKLSGTIKNLAKEPLCFDKVFIYKGKNYLPFACSLDVISNTMNITTMQEVEPYTTHSFVEIKSELVTGGGATISGGNNTALQYSAEVGNAKRISELNNASESEKKESYIVIDNANWNESKKVPLSEMEGLDAEQVEEYLTENKYAKQSWVKGITDDLETDIANRVLIEDYDKLQEAVDLNYANLNKATTRISTLEGYFSNGVASNAAKLGGQLPSYYATKSALDTTNTSLSNLSTTVGTIAGNLSSLSGRVDTAEAIIKSHTDSIALNTANITANANAITALDSRIDVLETLGFVLKDGYIYTEKTIVSKGEIISGRRASGASTDVGGGGISSITAQMIADVLGYVPYSSANPAGYINSSALNGYAKLTDIPSLSGYATQSWVEGKKYLTAIPSEYITETELSNTLGGYQTKITSSNKLAYSLISGTPTLAAVATSGKYSDLSGVPTSLPASDVYAWAKAATKPTYTASEVGALSTGGGTLTGNLSAPLYLFGNGGGTYLDSGASGELVFYDLSARRIVMHSGNIGSQSVSYATSAGYAVKSAALVNNSSELKSVAYVSGNTFYIGDSIYATTSTQILGKDVRLRYGASATFGLILSGSGNVLIGTTTDRGYKLYVNGTSYFGSSLSVNGNITATAKGTFSDIEAKSISKHDSGTGYYVGGRNYGLGATDGGALVYAYGATPISFYTNATERMRILSNGNILMGTTTEVIGKLQVEGDIYATAWIRTKGAAGWYSQDYGGGIYMTDANYVRVYNGKGFQVDGNVLIGNTTDRGHKLAVIRENSTMTASTLHNSALFIGASNSVDSYGLNLWTEGSGDGFIQQGRTDEEQPKLYNLSLQPFGGNVLVGTTANSGDKLNINGSVRAAGHIRLDRYHGASEYLQLESEDVNINYRAYDTDGWCSHNFYSNDNLLVRIDGYAGKLDINGNLVATGEVISSRRASSSDARLKDNINRLIAEDCLAMVRNLQPSSWDWKESGEHSMGFIAQDIEPLMPYAVTKIEDEVLGQRLNLQYDQFFAPIVGAIQCLDIKVNSHENEIEYLKKRVKYLENKLQEYGYNRY